MKVNIPDKCHENWNEMTANEKGRFCQNCQKTVVDFTQMSNTQIKDYLLERQGQKLCGRFKTDQLDKDISIAPKKRLSILPKIAASALLFAGVNQFAESQVDINANKQKQLSFIEIAKSQKETNKTVIHGKITDHDSKDISSVKIHFDDLKISFYSDEHGDFSFEIPENYYKEQVTLRFSKWGYIDVQQTFTLAQIKQGALRILMEAYATRISKVKGQIRGENNEPLLFINIVLDDSTVGTTSDSDGNYSITIPCDYKNDTIYLTASTFGFITKTVAVPTNKKETYILDIKLEKDQSIDYEQALGGYVIVKYKTPFHRIWHHTSWKVKRFFKTLINNNKFIK